MCLAFSLDLNGHFLLYSRRKIIALQSSHLTRAITSFYLLQILMSVLQRCITVMPILCVSTCLACIAVTVFQDTFVWMISLAQVSIKVH